MTEIGVLGVRHTMKIMNYTELLLRVMGTKQYERGEGWSWAFPIHPMQATSHCTVN